MECISRLEKEVADLRKILVEKENELHELKQKWMSEPQLESPVEVNSGFQNQTQVGELPRWAIERYSRQILLPEIGVEGQKKLCAARVLLVGAGGLGCPAAAYLAGAGVGECLQVQRQVLLPEIGVEGQKKLCAARVLLVGAGGLGCPAAAYLAGAGVGEIGLVDYDTVDLTNIHRQILHTEQDLHLSKVQSAADALRRINSNIKINQHNVQLDSGNALSIVNKYQVVLDCSDNVPTRYLLNDACVLTKLPLISGSALKMEGQLTVYGYRTAYATNDEEASGAPCYRCMFPEPPPPDTVGSCSANGVAGPVPGLIGALQALEAIKLVVGVEQEKLLVGRMLIFDGEDTTFKIVRLRGRNPDCAACSSTPTITHLLDYETFCKSKAKEKDLDLRILPPSHRISAAELFAQMRRERPLLVDVRSAPEFQMCRIGGAVNYPIDTLMGERLEQLLKEIWEYNGPVTFICRRGNDSQMATRRVLDALCPTMDVARVTDLDGGLHAWAKHVDTDFPVY